MTGILWLKFPEEVLFRSHFTQEDQKNLERIFSQDNAQSPWRQALAVIGLESSGADGMIKWHRDVPYFNWSEYVRVVSGGAMRAASAPGGGYGVEVSYKIFDLFSLLKAQAKMARFLTHKPKAMEPLTESLALGLALQSLVMRLNAEAAQMALWLAVPGQAPQKHRKILTQIQSIQMQRTAISSAWSEIFEPESGDDDMENGLPDFFWDEVGESAELQNTAPVSGQSTWKGLSVCAGLVNGRIIAVTRETKSEDILAIKREANAKIILLFRRARPETVEMFALADGLLFAEGGMLSHACTVAREMNIPAVTGFGADFYDVMLASQKTWATIDGAAGTVSIIPPG